ncbi:hypothetical protein EVAR_83280_1 [Eumeta japonica]|uniref:Uncharacterized protein n=1 Tax=Eumeta variegata TaxID=151549 RepID=A0A4C1X704_EUMVA|nr:hypothetical protein EVAR_83280_1 [Eumeta japonica]
MRHPEQTSHRHIEIVYSSICSGRIFQGGSRLPEEGINKLRLDRACNVFPRRRPVCVRAYAALRVLDVNFVIVADKQALCPPTVTASSKRRP